MILSSLVLLNPNTAISIVKIELPTIAATAKKVNTYEITHLIYISLEGHKIHIILTDIFSYT